jgi:hypothetical protein
VPVFENDICRGGRVTPVEIDFQKNTKKLEKTFKKSSTTPMTKTGELLPFLN